MHWKWRLFITISLATTLPLVLYIILAQQADHSQWLTIGGALLLAFVLGWALYASISRPIEYISSEAEDMVEGNFQTTTRFDKISQPFGLIGDSLRVISNKLQEFASRTQAEADVISAEANRLRMILNSINDGVLALDSNKHIILFNKAASEITGLSINDVAGRHINDVMPLMKNKRLIVSEWFDTCQNSDMNEISWDGITLRKQDTEILQLDVDALYVGADPNGVRMLLTFHNRSEEQQIEDMKVDFVALAAHELRTPVAIIRGYLEILGQELEGQLSEEHREFIRKLDISATQLAGSINNILHVSHIEHGELNLQKEVSDWGEIVTNACSELNIKAHEQRKSIELIVDKDIPAVAVDKTSITEVLNNLIDNALKYSEPDSKVSVVIRHKKQTVSTEVIDRGIGIPPNAVGKLFTKFYRSHRTRTSHRGTGLGLYMSKAIVEAHNGHIWVESKEGEGSVFGFELPAVAKRSDGEDNNDITRGVHGWIKNHSLYKG